ncbi:MAG: HIT family protein [Actinomycetota bacterium]|jgi:diadenosine tetraphosphate (Ap4A) HIT family hydrolase
MMRYPDCPACRGAEGDPELHRTEVWSDDLWRLTTSLSAEVGGFSYLEPRRHIVAITALDGAEARTLGEVLGRCTAALKDATGAEQVYIYSFGSGIPHLHLMLAPHRQGDALSDWMLKGEAVETPLPNGAVLISSADYPPLPEDDLRVTADLIRRALAD